MVTLSPLQVTVSPGSVTWHSWWNKDVTHSKDDLAGMTDLVCTPMPCEDHSYTMPESLLEEARLASTVSNRDCSISQESNFSKDKMIEAKDVNNEIKNRHMKYNSSNSEQTVSKRKKLNAKLTKAEPKINKRKPRTVLKNKSTNGQTCLSLFKQRKSKYRTADNANVTADIDTCDVVKVEDIGEMLEISQSGQERFREEDDETRRLHEGVHALLNLASSAARYASRSNVSSTQWINDKGDKNIKKTKQSNKQGKKTKVLKKLSLKKQKSKSKGRACVNSTELKSVQLLVSAICKTQMGKIQSHAKSKKGSNSVFNEKKTVKKSGVVDISQRHQETGISKTRRSSINRQIVSVGAEQEAISKLRNTYTNLAPTTAVESKFRRSCRKRRLCE